MQLLPGTEQSACRSPAGYATPPNGQGLGASGNFGTDRGFTGQTVDAMAGLYWFASRSYDPSIGRFVQPDSVVPDWTNPQALNRYAYALNNPLRYVDPSGHDPWASDPDFITTPADEPITGDADRGYTASGGVPRPVGDTPTGDSDQGYTATGSVPSLTPPTEIAPDMSPIATGLGLTGDQIVRAGGDIAARGAARASDIRSASTGSGGFSQAVANAKATIVSELSAAGGKTLQTAGWTLGVVSATVTGDEGYRQQRAADRWRSDLSSNAKGARAWIRGTEVGAYTFMGGVVAGSAASAAGFRSREAVAFAGYAGGTVGNWVGNRNADLWLWVLWGG